MHPMDRRSHPFAVSTWYTGCLREVDLMAVFGRATPGKTSKQQVNTQRKQEPNQLTKQQ